MLDYDTPVRSVRQIVEKDGTPYPAYLTSPLWVGYDKQQFAFPTYNNKVTAYTTGEDYYTALLDAIKNAKKDIFIAGWQVNWDAQLAPGVRLFDALLGIAQENKAIQIYVMPWKNSAPIETYATQTQGVLGYINQLVGRRAVYVGQAPSLADSARFLQPPPEAGDHRPQTRLRQPWRFV